MAKRTVVWTETAARQRRNILLYWTKRNGNTKYAEKLIKLIANQTKIISGNPSIFKQTDFPNTHISSLGYFSIVYKITKDQIIVTAFWDNRQDPQTLLDLLNN